jgi:hypothetical protein
MATASGGDRSNGVIPDSPRAKEVCAADFEFYLLPDLFLIADKSAQNLKRGLYT